MRKLRSSSLPGSEYCGRVLLSVVAEMNSGPYVEAEAQALVCVGRLDAAAILEKAESHGAAQRILIAHAHRTLLVYHPYTVALDNKILYIVRIDILGMP